MANSTDNACLLPPQRNKWTIHGVWPSKHGSFGPEFCNNSLRLNISALEPLKDELKKYWPNTHKVNEKNISLLQIYFNNQKLVLTFFFSFSLSCFDRVTR